MTDNLLRFRKNQKFLVLDAETENLSLYTCPDHHNRPWEIGYVLTEGRETIKEASHYIWWQDLNIGEDAARITRFDYEKYKSGAENSRKVYDEFARLLYDPSIIVVGQNILNFDAAILQNWRKELGLKPDWSFIERVIDTRALGFAIQKGVKSVDRDDLFCWQMKYMNTRERGIKTSLEYLAKYYGLFYSKDQHHGALFDSKLTRDVFFKQIWEVEI